MPRVAIGGFQHETHSFTDHRADFAHFALHRDRPPLVRGDDLRRSLQGSAYALAGFLEAQRPGDEVIPLVWASGGAGGVVTDDAFERIVGELIGRLSAVAPVDGVYLDLHGAMVNETFNDAEAEILRRVRAVVGEQVPIVISLDYHANISPEMVMLSDGLVVCKTYPHVDRPETGQRAAHVLQDLMARGRPAGRALRKTPFLLPLDFQCTLSEPSRSVVQWTPAQTAGLIDVEYAAGFPPSDTPWCGPSIVVHASTQAAADATADAYLQFVCACESRFATRLWPTDEGVREAMRLAQGAQRPIIVADTQDNPGAGGSGDTTGILDALIRLGADGVTVGYFHDPFAAKAACDAGEGALLDLALVGRHGPQGVAPLQARVEVLRTGQGPFRLTGAVAGNVVADLGPMALLRLGGVQMAVTSRNVQAFDTAPFMRLGVDLKAQRILVLKSSCHFRAEFGPLSDEVLTVLAPGAYDPDPANYPYRRLRGGVRFKPVAPAR